MAKATKDIAASVRFRKTELLVNISTTNFWPSTGHMRRKALIQRLVKAGIWEDK